MVLRSAFAISCPYAGRAASIIPMDSEDNKSQAEAVAPRMKLLDREAADPLAGDFYIGSADWMPRNLSGRVEVTPIEPPLCASDSGTSCKSCCATGGKPGTCSQTAPTSSANRPPALRGPKRWERTRQ